MYEGYEKDYGEPVDVLGKIALYERMKNPPIDWLIEGLFKDKGIGMLYGASGGMKSYGAADTACRVTNGMPVMGRTTKKGKVIYIAGEAAEETNDRIETWMRFHGKDERPLICPWAIQLHNSKDINDLIELTKKHEAKLVIIDNLADCTAGVALSDPDDVGEKLKPNVLSFVQQAKASLLMLHHTGHKTDHERGARVLRDMTDLTIQSKKNDSNNLFGTWEVEKLRRISPDRWPTCHFRIQDVSEQTGMDNMAIIQFRHDEFKNKGKVGKAAVSVEDDQDDTNPIVDYMTEHGLAEEERNTIAKALDMWRESKSCVNSTFERYEKEAIKSKLLERDGKSLKISPQAWGEQSSKTL